MHYQVRHKFYVRIFMLRKMDGELHMFSMNADALAQTKNYIIRKIQERLIKSSREFKRDF